MMPHKSLWACAALITTMIAAPTAAHHSFAMFDQTKQVTVKGKVSEFQWTNPHAFIEIDVPNQQRGTDRWSIELNSPNNLTRQGWKRNSLKPGDEVTLTFNPLRNGKKGGLFNLVVKADGTSLGERATAGGRPINIPTAN